MADRTGASVLKDCGTILGSAILAILGLAALGTASGWVVSLVVGSPAGYGHASAYGACGGFFLGAVSFAVLRGHKGVQTWIGAAGLGALLSMGVWKVIGHQHPPGWIFGAAVWGGGFGGLVAFFSLLMLIGTLGSSKGVRSRSKPDGPSNSDRGE